MKFVPPEQLSRKVKKVWKMKQEERRIWLIRELVKEQPQYQDIVMPSSEDEQKKLLRALFNVRPPMAANEKFLEVQDEYLTEAAVEKGIVYVDELAATEADSRLILWQGDITCLGVGAIVNAANSGMTGCYHPNHNCIDNCIHTYAGVQLRYDCAKLMEKQGHEEATGIAKITSAFNLLATYVLHTVGPIVQGRLTEQHNELLRNSYLSCLKLADKYEIESVAFCCISTGVFGFPQKEAAEIAVETVKQYLSQNTKIRKVVFNVFQSSDYQIYRKLLGADKKITDRNR